MRKRVFCLLIIIIMLITVCNACGNTPGTAKITLGEAAHSVFYAPLYVAIEKGYFTEEGINLRLVNCFGSDKAMSAIAKGDCDIGLLGPETSIYSYNKGEEDYIVNFAQLTQRAGDFLVSRVLNEEFDWDNLIGKTVLGGRADGMPEMVFEYILKKHGLNPESDLTIVKDIDFGSTAQTFSDGQGDYTMEFEPAATALDTSGKGKLVAALGMESGKVPYTVFSAKKSYIEQDPDLLLRFTNALQKGMDYIAAHNPEEVAKVIKPQFTDTDKDRLTGILKEYYDQNTWKENLIFEEGSYTLLSDIMIEAGQLEKSVPYKTLVTTEFADKAANK